MQTFFAAPRVIICDGNGLGLLDLRQPSTRRPEKLLIISYQLGDDWRIGVLRSTISKYIHMQLFYSGVRSCECINTPLNLVEQ